MSKIRLIERDLTQISENDPTKKAYRYKWEVHAPADIFGKRIRKFFKTKGEAKAEKLTLETKLQNQRLTPLIQEIHLCVARYQKRLTPGQMEEALSGAVEFYDHTNKPLKDFADAYVVEKMKDIKRGHLGKRHAVEMEGKCERLVEWLGNPKIRSITKRSVEDFIDERLDAVAKPVTVRNYCTVLSSILHRAVDDGVLNHHPMKKIRLPKSDTEVGILMPDELDALLSKAAAIMEERPPWHTISNEQLQALVWSKPMLQISKEMGVSDVAIRKRCRKVGIKTPPPGFWRKVETGKIPHPNGACEGNEHRLVVDTQANGFRINDPALIPTIMIPRLMFGCFAGLRTSEIQRLTWEDVRLDLGQLYVAKGKNKNSERWVTLTPPLLDWCEKRLAAGGGYLGLKITLTGITAATLSPKHVADIQDARRKVRQLFILSVRVL